MTTTKLLTGVAIAALLSGTALAQTVSVSAAGGFDGDRVPSELNGPQTGTAILNFILDDQFTGLGAGATVRATFTLNGATFNGIVPAGAWSQATSTECNFGQPVLGGGAGGTTVSFDSQVDMRLCGNGAASIDATANDGALTLPLSVADPDGPVTISSSFVATADPGTYVSPSLGALTVLDTSRAITFSAASGAANSGQFSADGKTLEGTGVIGTLSLAAFPVGPAAIADIAISDTGLTAPSQIAASASLAVTFPSGTTGIGSLTLGTANCGAPVAGVYTCPLSGAAVNALIGNSSNITITSDANPLTAVTPQTPEAVLTVTSAAGYTAAGVASTSLAPIGLNDGISVTAFGNDDYNWVRIGSGGTESNFRVNLGTAAEAAQITDVRIAIAEGSGVAAQTIVLPIGTDADTQARIQGSTLTFNSRALGAVAGVSGNADILSISVQHGDVVLTTAEVAAANVVRQLVNRSPSSFVATPGLTTD